MKENWVYRRGDIYLANLGAVSYTHLDVYKRQVQANPQHLSGFFTLNQFIHHQNSLPFGICLAFFSLPVPDYNIQAALSHLHQFRASVPCLPCRDTESHRSYHMYQAAPPIPSKILPCLLYTSVFQAFCSSSTSS